MDVKELRIWNNIVDCYGSINTISSIHEGGTIRFKDDTVCHIDKCKPIELTEELLLKCGFEKRLSNYEEAECHDYYLDGFKYISNSCSWYLHNCTIKIEYVHQLQNLYFALTGEELTIVF